MYTDNSPPPETLQGHLFENATNTLFRLSGRNRLIVGVPREAPNDGAVPMHQADTATVEEYLESGDLKGFHAEFGVDPRVLVRGVKFNERQKTYKAKDFVPDPVVEVEVVEEPTSEPDPVVEDTDPTPDAA